MIIDPSHAQTFSIFPLFPIYFSCILLLACLLHCSNLTLWDIAARAPMLELESLVCDAVELGDLGQAVSFLGASVSPSMMQAARGGPLARCRVHRECSIAVKH